MDISFVLFIFWAAAMYVVAYRFTQSKRYGVALIIILGVCLVAPADADELSLENTWLDFGDFGAPTVLEPVAGKTKIFMGEAYSIHFDNNFDYNEEHQTYGFEYSIDENWGVNVSTFENSFFERSYSLAVVYNWKRYGLGDNVEIILGGQIGIADGYSQAKFNTNGFIPVVAPFVDIVSFQSIGARFSVWNAQVANVSFYLEF